MIRTFPLLLLFLVASTPLFAASKPYVFVSILPQKFFIEQIAGDLVQTKVMVEPGQAPETYEPTPQKMAALSKAQRYFSMGLTFEKKLLDSIDRQKIVGSKESSDYQEKNESEHEHEHEEHEHGHQHDPHTWLDPIAVKAQAKQMYLHLATILPAHTEVLEKNYLKFAAELDSLHSEIELAFKQSPQQHFLIFHPALGHYSERYHLNQVSIEKDGKLPSARHMAGLMKQLGKSKLKYILVEQQFSQKEARTIAKQLGAELLVIDPLGYSYFDNLRHITRNVKKALY